MKKRDGILWVVAASMALLAGCAHHPVEVASPADAPPPKIQIAALPLRINHWTNDWTPIFNGKTLENWAITDFGGHGEVRVANNRIEIPQGAEMTGITWTNGTLPKTDYEIFVETMKMDGGDFFCGLTFPVGESECSLILGGWGGSVVGLSSLDENDASENETSRSIAFKNNHWYRVRVRVTGTRIQAWLDDQSVVDVATTGRRISLRPGPIILSAPLGIATYETAAAVRAIKLRLLDHGN